MSRSKLIGFGAATILLLSACGGAPTSGSGGSDKETKAEAVYAEVGPLTGDARHDRLVELAEEEGNALSIYTSLNAEVLDTLVPIFEKETGIKVKAYRAESSTVLQRVLQESSANFAGADVVESNSREMVAIAGEGLFGDYESDQRAKVNKDFQQDLWTPSRLNIFAPAWNTDKVKGDLIPKTWADLADPKYDGILSLELGDFDWYMALYGYFQDEGMEDKDIDKLFKDMVEGSKVASGHSGQTELLSAGEFAVVASPFTYLTAQARNSGAPVDDQPFVEPIIVRANGAGLTKSSKHPAAAMLFMDWYLSDGQALLLKEDLTPSIMPDGSDPLEGLTTISVDSQQLIDEGDEWSKRYAEVLRGGEQLPKS
ncbi:ABC transporter substrate-binding protein [Aeromicrobium wangtongii]|uniref:ABC transporter substrate-binding protein n=1 Tax=Aeromicrobium wangtongii TaxID=2969247 RepID=UPI002016D343|nr:extracellular solute-binding protein [Aeromicrobium wangtongii]MCL3817647.1 extracellular solute-binding protein [Aeromicrobium wangtongii]